MRSHSTVQNPGRRKLLQGTGAVVAVTLVPAATAAACNKFTGKEPDSGLTVEVADAGVSHVDAELLRVSVSNQTKNDIQLSSITPGALNIDGQSYNLNSALGKGPLTIKPNTVRHFWLSPDSYYKPRNNINLDTRSQLANLPVNILRATGSSTVQNVKAHVLIS